MTVIEDVLAAEKLSEEKVLEAKEKATEAISSAKEEQTKILNTKKEDLAKKESEEVLKHQKDVQNLAADINKDAESQVSSIATKFDLKKSEVSEVIKKAL